MRASEIDRIARAQRGDEAAFAELYQEHISGVFRYAKSIVRDVADAEDVSAQVFLQAWKGLPGLKRPEGFSAWLFRIVHNVALNAMRHRDHRNIDAIPEPVDEDRFGDPHAALEAKLDAAVVRSALRQLSPSDRDVLALRYYAGMSYAEVGQQLGKREQAARVAHFRALERLRSIMAASANAPVLPDYRYDASGGEPIANDRHS